VPRLLAILLLAVVIPRRPTPVLSLDDWDLSATGVLGGTVNAIASDPRNPSRIYAGGLGVFRSEDFGSTWQRLDPDRRPTILRVDPSDSNRLYSVENGTLSRSDDAGATWNPASTPAPIRDLVVDAGGTVFASTDAGLFRSHDTGSSWTPASKTRSGQDVHVMTADPQSPGIVYGAAVFSVLSDEVYKSVDGGTSWTGPVVRTDFLEGVVDLVVDRGFPGALYVARSLHDLCTTSGTVASTSDDGASWKEVFGGNDVGAVVLDPVQPGTLYVSVPGTCYGPPIVYRSSSTRISHFGVVNPSHMEISADGSVIYVVTSDRKLARRPTAVSAPAAGLVPFR
jgi:photosystem II stability/assembly factor-like uncharacterized protein